MLNRFPSHIGCDIWLYPLRSSKKMKTFKEFLSEDGRIRYPSTISRGDTGGTSGYFGKPVDRTFKKRPKTGLGKYLKDKFKNRNKDKPEQEKPGRDTGYRGQGAGRKDIISRPKPGAQDHHQKVALPPGKERPASPSKDSMVARRMRL